MTERLAAHANDTTPKGVAVPANIVGILTWAIGRFGAGAIFLAAAYLMYCDLKAERIVSFNLIQQNIDALHKNAEQLGRMNDTLIRIEGH